MSCHRCIFSLQMKCCGVHNAEGWKPVFKGYIHAACCQKKMGDNTCTKSSYGIGCEDKIKDFLASNIALAAGLSIGFGVLQVSTLHA